MATRNAQADLASSMKELSDPREEAAKKKVDDETVAAAMVSTGTHDGADKLCRVDTASFGMSAGGGEASRGLVLGKDFTDIASDAKGRDSSSSSSASA